ncbi:hypothetical protein VCRA2110O2_30318 [Vibrio crassostreae]|nr:hypothetical protein VCHA44O286_50059 [Vibrio chagasii]CAK2873112.1 hypothetical protein VCRA2110O2_30318 [Vibrio crassostreae]
MGNSNVFSVFLSGALPIVIFLLSALLLTLSIKQRFGRNKIDVPEFNEAKPYYIALDLNGEVYGIRKFSHLSNFQKSMTLQEWTDEAAVVRAVSHQELLEILKKTI